jgi:hypothetical protein
VVARKAQRSSRTVTECEPPRRIKATGKCAIERNPRAPDVRLLYRRLPRDLSASRAATAESGAPGVAGQWEATASLRWQEPASRVGSLEGGLKLVRALRWADLGVVALFDSGHRDRRAPGWLCAASGRLCGVWP